MFYNIHYWCNFLRVIRRTPDSHAASFTDHDTSEASASRSFFRKRLVWILLGQVLENLGYFQFQHLVTLYVLYLGWLLNRYSYMTQLLIIVKV